MISDALEASLRRALELAASLHHEYATSEHLLLAMLEDPDARAALLACRADLPRLRAELESWLAGLERVGGEPVPTLAFQRVLQRAVAAMQAAGKDQTTGANVLVALLSEQPSRAARLLQAHGVGRLPLTTALARAGQPAPGEMAPDPEQDPLELYCRPLSRLAQQGKLEPLIGREAELARLYQVLARKYKNNPLLVGDPGVGKTALIEGLAQRVQRGRVPVALLGLEFYALDLGALLAGSRYRGDFEERLRATVAALQARPGAVLCIDEIHTVVGAGAVSGGSLDASNLLKPALASLRCIGATTYAEYRVLERDRALLRRFQRVDLPEPSPAETLEILRGVAAGLASHHQVRYPPAALRSALDLSVRHLQGRRLPDKAIDVLDEAGADLALRGPYSRPPAVGSGQVAAVVARMAGLAVGELSRRDSADLVSLEERLRRVVFGQDTAVARVSAAIRLSRAGLRQEDKPVGSFLFVGPTGVGKTELAKQLAGQLGLPLLRFDMSEYQERHAVARLIGAPPGYVGHEQGGLLTDAVFRSPQAVLLLDEIEKAHPDLWNVLLQVMDYGRLTDSQGRQVDFRGVLLILTSNLGAAEAARPPLGFVRGSELASGRQGEAVERTFSPEFRNRLDATVLFSELSPQALAQVVDRQLSELARRAERRGVLLQVSSELRAWLGEQGSDARYGARPLARLIEQRLSLPLAELILAGSARRRRVLATLGEQGPELHPA